MKTKQYTIVALILIVMSSVVFINADLPRSTATGNQALPSFIPTPFGPGSRGNTWDGRVFSTIGSVAGKPTLIFSVFRPEYFSQNVTNLNGGLPSFNSQFLFGATGQATNFYDAINDFAQVTAYSKGLRVPGTMSANAGAPFSTFFYNTTYAQGYPTDESGLSTHAIAADPAYLENPVRSGNTDTYYLIVYSTSIAKMPDCVETNSSVFGLGAMKVTVTVENAKKLDARVSSAVVTSNWQRLNLATPFTVGSGATAKTISYVCGRHPSVTDDGRLIVFEDAINISYIWNQSSVLTGNGYLNKWTQPLDVTKMYYAEKNSTINGIKFSDKYSVARRPMKDGLGRPYRDETGLPLWTDGQPVDPTQANSRKLGIWDLDRHLYLGGYPWISPDGTDILNASVNAWQAGQDTTAPNPLDPSQDRGGPIRAGEVAIGFNTKYAQRHIDSPINQNRASLTLLNQVRNSLTEKFLASISKSSIDDLTEDESRVLRTRIFTAVATYSRLIISSLGPLPSMWGPYRDVPQFQLPYTRAKTVFPIFSFNGQYDEISFDDTRDGNNLLYMHMQENIQRTVGVGPRSVPQVFQSYSNLDDALNAYTGTSATTATRYEQSYDPSRTPDSSGNEKSDGSLSYGVLSDGAAFPQEYNNRDETVGALGQGIYFPESGFVKVQNDGQLNNIGRLITVQFFYKRLVNLAPLQPSGNPWRYLLRKSGVFDVILERNGGIQASFYVKKADGTVERIRSGFVSTPVTGSADCTGTCHPSERPWTHVAIRYNGFNGRMDVYVNGQIVVNNKVFSSGVLNVGSSPLIIGPGSSTVLTPPNQAFVLMDEVSIANTFRPEDDIKAQAFVKKAPPTTAVLPDGVTLPLGLKTQDLKGQPYYKITPAKINLGQMIFSDPRFSKNGLVSCQTCHNPQLAFTDGLEKAMGQAMGTRNSPTIFNRSFGTRQFWDGRGNNVEHQVLLPLIDQKEHGLLNADEIVTKLNDPKPAPGSSDTYTTLFKRAGMASNIEFVRQALGSFVRTRFAANSRVDQFENGTLNALTAQEKKGRALFHGKARCIACHSGSNYSDESFHNTGMAENTYTGKNWSTADLGRYRMTGQMRDIGLFKTPTLRDVNRTAPYLHDGSVSSLEEIIELYNQGSVGTPNVDPELMPLGLSQDEKDALAAFLRALDSQP